MLTKKYGDMDFYTDSKNLFTVYRSVSTQKHSLTTIIQWITLPNTDNRRAPRISEKIIKSIQG